MNLYNLKNFCTIAKEPSISQAAKVLNVSQPALSKMMRQMEEELGFFIFDRSSKGTVLNENGRVFLKMAEKVLLEYDSCIESLREVNGETSKNIILSFSSCGKYIPILTYSFKKLHPDAWFEIKSYEKGRLDTTSSFFLHSSATKEEADDFTDYLGCEELFVTAGENTNYAGRSSIALSELSSRSFLSNEPSNDMYHIQKFYCEKAGFTPLNDNLVEKQNILIDLLRLGIGVSIMPRIHYEGLVQIPISDAVCYRYIYLRRNTNTYQTKYAREFRSMVVEYFRNNLKREAEDK